MDGRIKTYAKREIIGRDEASETLHTLAHDLRTPMCCVVGAAQLALAAARQGKNIDAQLQQILQAVGAMDDVLRAACGMREETAFSAEALENELRAVMIPKAKEKDQQLRIDLRALYGVVCDVDGAALARVLLNLLGNAVKYTPEGGAVVLLGGLRPGLRPGQAGRMVFSVRDNGIGMKPEFLEKLYQPGCRAQETAHLPGKGLGLSIVRRLVREMGGTIGVASEWGTGTAFTVSIPYD